MFKRFLPTAVAMLFGVLVLLGYLLPIGVFFELRVILLGWATVLAAFALVLAYLSILRVHISRIVQAKKGNTIASVLIIVTALASLLLVLLNGTEGRWTQEILLDAILVPGESALLALTAITLIVSGMRIFRERRNLGSVAFIAVAILILLTTVAPPLIPPLMQSVERFVNAMAAAGMRGVLMGVALGTVLTGLRTVLGIDRPHSDD